VSDTIASYRGEDQSDEDRDQRRRDVANWVASAGVDPSNVLDEFTLTREPGGGYLLRVKQFTRTPAGAIVADPDSGKAQTRELYLPVVKGSWPQWLDVSDTGDEPTVEVNDLGNPDSGQPAIGPRSAVPADQPQQPDAEVAQAQAAPEVEAETPQAQRKSPRGR
jgi:hypothetical protein